MRPKTPRVRAVGLILLLTPLVYLCRFVQDDAFISFRYAANWIAGHGLVFNPGERVEGYTNFLWTALMAVPHALGIDPVNFVHLAGLILFPLGLVATYRLADALFETATVARVAVLLTGTHYGFAAWATGGLETSLHTWLVTSCIASVVLATSRGWTPTRSVIVSLFAALSVLTRLDSVVLLGLPGVVAVWSVLREKGRRRILILGLLAPFVGLVLPWLSWKVSYYGELLPNTFWVRLGNEVLLRNGVAYLGSFSLSYVLFPLPFVVLLLRKRLLARLGSPRFVLLLGPVLLWGVYLLRAGGDFMEFRFMVPVVPLLMVTTAWVLIEVIRRPALRGVSLAILVAASLAHGVWFERSPLRRPWIESVPSLQRWLDHPEYGWIGLGRFLGRYLGEPRDAARPVRIALTPAGAIPYYSQLETVDMHGLNDRWVARNGMRLGSRAFHRTIAPLEYLIERQVHLVLGHPQNLRQLPGSGETFEARQLNVLQILPDPEQLPPRARVIVVPYGSSAGIVVLYLTPHPDIDATIRREGWPVYEIGPLTGSR